MQYDDRIAHFVLNNQEYRDSLHIAPFANETQSLAGFFEMCTQRINFTHEVPSTIPYHMANIEQGEHCFAAYLTRSRDVQTLCAQAYANTSG